MARTKVCAKCKKIKGVQAFAKCSKQGRRSRCKICSNEDNAAYRLAHPEKAQASRDKYAETNPEKVKESKTAWRLKNPDYGKEYYEENKEAIGEACKVYRIANKDKINKKHKERYDNDTQYKLGILLRTRLGKVVSRDSKRGSAVRDLGCTVAELKVYIEALFKPGMSWENWRPDGWHIDHIIPLAAFDLTDREQFLKACHYTNLQPLWAEENLTKHAKVL